MSTRGKKTDWWEILLWIGLGILVVLFLLELVKLWNAGVVAAQGWPAAIGQAFQNTVDGIESGIASALSGPLSFLSFIPNLFNMIWSGLASLFNALSLTTIGTFFSNLASGFSAIGAAVGAGSAQAALFIGQGNGGYTSGSVTTPPAPTVLNPAGTAGITGNGFSVDQSGN